MEKYKICPVCKTKNGPALLECINCEADLTRVKITDEETEKLEEQAHAEEQTQKKAVRVCECGAKNPARARKCSACGEDISDITPTSEEEQAPTEAEYVLSSMDGKYAYKLAQGETTVGRACAMNDYLSGKIYVSRVHAKLTLANGELTVENLSGTNFTFVNNSKITEATRLCDGDELALGGMNVNGMRQKEAAYFLVRIGQCM